MNNEVLYNSLNIANRVKAQAKAKKIPLKVMLSEIGLGTNTMSNLRHDRMIAADSLALIADYLDCSVDYLMGRTDKPEVNK
jgi:transcriptional regulator with XRE-family HTH domain